MRNYFFALLLVIALPTCAMMPIKLEKLSPKLPSLAKKKIAIDTMCMCGHKTKISCGKSYFESLQYTLDISHWADLKNKTNYHPLLHDLMFRKPYAFILAGCDFNEKRIDKIWHHKSLKYKVDEDLHNEF